MEQMPNRIERLISFVAAILGIGQVAWVVYGHFKSISIPFWLYLTSVVTAFIAGVGVSRLAEERPRPVPGEAFKEIGRVSFDYLPDSPVNHGWTLHVDGENGTPPLFSSAQASPTPGAIKIVKNNRYALDYSVNQIQALANMVELYARFEQSACFYVKVKLSSRDGNKVQNGWLAHVLGNGVPTKPFKDEWKIPVQGNILEGGWVQLKLSVEDEISKTFGADGWIFQELIGFRIRGSASISSVILYRIGGSTQKGQQVT